MKKKPPLDLAIAPPTPAPFHVDDGDDQPKQRPQQDDDVPRHPPGEHQLPYSQTTRMGTAMRSKSVPGSIPRTISSAVCNVTKRIDSKEAIVNTTLCFIGFSL